MIEDDAHEYDDSHFEQGIGRPREVIWEAPEHHHTEKGSDWYWALGIITIAGAITTIIFGNVLFGIVILLAGIVMALISSKHPRIITYAVSTRGVRVGTTFYPYSALKCFYINEEHHRHIQLLMHAKSIFAPLIVIPVPDDALEDIEYLIEPRLPEEHLKESFGQYLLEFLGF